ncbi:GUN4 domain-containing protein [Calothrix sp. NIES-2100]|uniref:GUN4 domain-containing protein n=1 Tax=Calothrix sp. NIES-2100 TaxID=1954172 RepID=UPI000B61D226|nr:GUN4 domain-containing protein [Calothrix sp. NIES-2100]
MLGWIFGGFVKKLERSAKKVSRDFVKSSSKEINDLFDKQVYPLADKIDYIAKKRIQQTEKLEAQFIADIETLINNAEQKIQKNLQEINEIRESAIRDVRQTVGEVDAYLENRINQISLTVMRALSQTEEITQIIFEQVNILEEKLFQDTNYLIDKINEDIDGKLELISNELKKHLAHALPNPLDKCRQRLNIGLKPGAMLSDVELYQLTECYELSKLNENTSIDEVINIYGQLQLNAARMAALVKKSPVLKRRAMEDWLRYGLLCEFWSNTMENYAHTENYLLEPQQPQKFLTLQIIEELAELKRQLSQLLQNKQYPTHDESDSQKVILASLSNLQSQFSQLEAELTLVSPTSGINYSKLRDLLAENKWQEADKETSTYMLRISEREEENWLDDGDIKKFPRHDLRIINNLWIKYSDGKFGFSVQKQIWQDSKEDYKRFGDRVGWLVNLVNSEWRKYEEAIFSLDAPEGHLPYTIRVLGLGYRNPGEISHRLKRFLPRY